MCPEGSLMMNGLQAFVAFSATYYMKVSSICLNILGAYTLVWLSWHFYKMAAAISTDPKQIVDDITRIVVGQILLNVPSLVWELYTTLLSVGVWSAGQAYSAADGSHPGNVGELACYAINGIDHAMFNAVKLAISQMSIMQLANALWVIVLFIPVAALMVRIMKHVSEPLVDVSMLFVLMPFVVLAGSIGPLASAAMQSLKLMVVALKELIVASAIVGVMMAMINQAAGWSPVQGDSVDVAMSSTWLGGAGYFMTLALVLFFFFAFDRAIQMPGRLFTMFTPRGISFRIPHPF